MRSSLLLTIGAAYSRRGRIRTEPEELELDELSRELQSIYKAPILPSIHGKTERGDVHEAIETFATGRSDP